MTSRPWRIQFRWSDGGHGPVFERATHREAMGVVDYGMTLGQPPGNLPQRTRARVWKER